MTHIQANNDAFASLADKIVVLTGGATGIGRSAVEQFASHGAKVVFGDVQDSVGQEVATAAGPSVTFQHCDASSYADQLALFDKAKELHGHIDIAVANAGVVVHKDPFAPDSDWRQEPTMREIDVNLKGALYSARIAQGHMRQTGSGGDIVITSSVAGFKECAGIATYTASKHGSIGLLRGINLSAIKDNIRVNVVCPWMTHTDMSKGFADDWISAGLPKNDPADVARAILMCASANRTKEGAGHGNAVLPFAGKILFVGGGESYEIEDNIQALEPQWLGQENAVKMAKGQEFLGWMGDWDKPKKVAVNGEPASTT